MQLRKNKRKLQAELTKQRILQSAAQLFSEYGFANVSIEDIAHASECSVGGIYHYFASKDEIAAHAITTYDDEADKFYHDFICDQAETSLSGFEKLKEFMVYAHCVCIKSDTLDHLFSMRLQHKNSSSLSLFDNQNYTQTIRRLIAQCRSEGYIAESRSDEDVFHLLTLASRGLFADWLFKKGSNEEFDMATMTRSLVDAVFMGIK